MLSLYCFQSTLNPIVRDIINRKYGHINLISGVREYSWSFCSEYTQHNYIFILYFIYLLYILFYFYILYIYIFPGSFGYGLLKEFETCCVVYNENSCVIFELFCSDWSTIQKKKKWILTTLLYYLGLLCSGIFHWIYSNSIWHNKRQHVSSY